MNEQAFKSFSRKEVFVNFINIIEAQGYVVDGKKENGLSFSSTQVEHMTQELYDSLCDLHEIENNINIHKTGHFYPEHGAYYIAFDGDRYEFKSARKVMDRYISTLE